MAEMMDDLDKRILEVLRRDGRKPTLALARCLGVAEATARKRLRRLLDLRVVEIIAVANSRLLGYEREIAVAMRVSPGAIDRLVTQFTAHPAVRFVVEGTGAFNLWVNATFRDHDDEIAFFDTQVKGDADIIDAQTMSITRVRRRSFDWLMGEVGYMRSSSGGDDDAPPAPPGG